MRLLHTFDDQSTSEKLSSFLKHEGIENLCEITKNTDWGSSDYGLIKCHIWVEDEDLFETAQKWLLEYESHPNNPIFATPEKTNAFRDTLFKNIPSPATTAPSSPQQNAFIQFAKQASLTLYIFLACACIFVVGEMTTPPFELPPLKLPLVALVSPPINKILMYDYPDAYESLDKFVKIYGLDGLQNYENLPPEALFLLKKIINTPLWDGFYSLTENYFLHSQPFHIQAPLFEKIRQGQLWRIFTPCLLHANLLHLFLNMLWLLYIGKLIEDRLGSFRYILLIIATAIVSNTAQYLMSGPNFLGFSGVLCGMLAFSWARHKKAPWEGYRLAPGTYSFIFITIMAMAAIQMLSFFLKIYFQADYFPSIANTAHIAGGITGYLMGRISLMGIKSG